MRIEVKRKIISEKNVNEFNDQLEKARIDGWYPDGDLIVSVVNSEGLATAGAPIVGLYTMVLIKSRELGRFEQP